MSIGPIVGENSPLSVYRGKRNKTAGKGAESARDTVELSSEARSRLETDQAGRMKVIRDRISEGYYFQPDVTSEIADKIVDDLLSKK